jgi:hypothetical protein
MKCNNQVRQQSPHRRYSTVVQIGDPVLLSFRGIVMGCEWCHCHREQSTRGSQVDDKKNIINEEI